MSLYFWPPASASASAVNIHDSAGLDINLGQQTAANSLPVVAAPNAAGNSPGSSTVSTVATLTKPANAVGFILMCLDTSTANIRYRIGAVATSSSGQQLQPGRDTGYIPCAADVSICAESGTQDYDIQWVLSS